MNDYLSDLAVIVSPAETIDSTIRLMSERSRSVAHPGLAVVIDSNRRLEGILTDGDLRRAYANEISFARPVADIMIREPITVSSTIDTNNILQEVYKRVRSSEKHSSGWVRHILLLDQDGRLNDILDFFQLLETESKGSLTVAVFGMGYVGLSVAVALANRGHLVTGIDVVEEVIHELSEGRPHVHEPGLRDMLKATLSRELITFETCIGAKVHGVYIIAVGTPLDEQLKPDLTALNQVTKTIGPLLKRGDLVMLRSTVPTGTTRDIVIPALEALSGLKAGIHFHVAFAPERTIEGRAMHELRTLPQVIGGYTRACLLKATQFWATLTPSVIQVATLEASELVKLANNSFRDLSFAFANELALIADISNVDAFDLIRAANDGYPRNPIPLPSPGVGGYCLTKDPILLSYTASGLHKKDTLGQIGRVANERAAVYPITVLNRFAKRYNKSLSDLSVLIVGIAFKGEPETSDVRGSTSLEVAYKLNGTVAQLYAWDAIVSGEKILSTGIQPITSLDKGIMSVDAVLILNNHRLNVDAEAYIKSRGQCLVFDGFHQLDAAELERVPGLTYATMGYMTPV